MRTLGVINTDPAIETEIKEAFERQQELTYKLRFIRIIDEILEFINYGLPELIIINFSDPQLDLDKIIDHIKNDAWILNFGIIGLFDQARDEEEKLFSRLKSLNILTLLDHCRISSHIVKNVNVIQRNHQVIFQQELTKKFFKGSSGSLTIENDVLVVPLFAGIGTTLLTQMGLINSEKKMLLQLTLAELIVNGVEHGNCRISYDEKTEAMERGLSVVEMVQERCKNPEIAVKKVYMDWNIQRDKSTFTIRDEGEGFDVAVHLEKTKKQDAMSLHGRGLQMALLIDQNLSYNDKGNEVTLTVSHSSQISQDMPVGFSKEQILPVKKGDIVFREGEGDDFLYYIVSGIFSVFYKKKLVGLLSLRDMFMGEMSFLLNEKRSATVRAETPGKLIRLSRKAFITVIRDYPHYGIFLSKLLAERLLRSNNRRFKSNQ